MHFRTQFRDLMPATARLVLHRLLAVPHFHYLPHISDIELLFDTEDPDQLLAWAWITPWTEGIRAVRMIDSLVRGKNYAHSLMELVLMDDEYDNILRPHDVVPSARGYWEKHGWSPSSWLSGGPPTRPTLKRNYTEVKDGYPLHLYRG